MTSFDGEGPSLCSSLYCGYLGLTIVTHRLDQVAGAFTPFRSEKPAGHCGVSFPPSSLFRPQLRKRAENVNFQYTVIRQDVSTMEWFGLEKHV